jgi:DNA polymerase-3 subunit gamma/tau
MSTTLYRKYRPQAWAEVAGQNHVKVTLSFEVATGRIAHAYLFSGPRGIGKTTTARIFAKALNCLERPKRGPGPEAGEPCGDCEACVAITEARALDVIEIDAASNRGIDNVRENIIENSRFSPSKLGYKVFIIDEVHMMTTEAFNALLKTLEEPPPRVVFILATTELHKVPPTIVSRCQRFDFRKIPFTDLVDRLHTLAEREKCKVDRRTLEEIARHSDGCLRDAEGLLGKVLTVGDGKRVTYDEALVVLPRSEYASLATFVEGLLRGDSRSALATLGDCLEGGVDLEQFATDAVELLRKTLLTKLSGNPDIVAFDLDESQKKDLLAWSELAELPRIVMAVELLMEKKRDMKSSHPIQLPLELAVVRMCADMRPAAAIPAQYVSNEAEKPRPAAPVKAEAPKSEKVPAPAVAAKAEYAPPPPSETAAASGDPVTTVDSLKSLWAEFIRRAGEENHALPYLLGVGEPISVVGQSVKIGFDFAFHKDKFNEEKNRRLLERALGSIVNAAVRVEGVLLEKKERLVHDDAAQPQPAMAAGPAVADSLLTAFGGRVVE